MLLKDSGRVEQCSANTHFSQCPQHRMCLVSIICSGPEQVAQLLSVGSVQNDRLKFLFAWPMSDRSKDCTAAPTAIPSSHRLGWLLSASRVVIEGPRVHWLKDNTWCAHRVRADKLGEWVGEDFKGQAFVSLVL